MSGRCSGPLARFARPSATYAHKNRSANAASAKASGFHISGTPSANQCPNTTAQYDTFSRMPYGIKPVPDYVAPRTTTAYYQRPAGDGTRAGVYFVNTYDLPSRPLYEIEALSLHNITTEVDRYITWPGQSIAYKTGELKIRELRERAERALGAGFDVRRFHDVVLENGSVPLDVLEKMVDAYIAGARGKG